MFTQLQDVFRSLGSHDVKYVVIGGIATVVHGVPRATFDLDILVEATPENARRLLSALMDVGFGTAALTNEDSFLDKEITSLTIASGSMFGRSLQASNSPKLGIIEKPLFTREWSSSHYPRKT